MHKRVTIAMLGEQAQAQQPPENLDVEVLEINQAQTETDAAQAVIDESREISDSLGSTTDRIEQMQTVPQEAIQVAQEQIKYCIKRTGLNMAGVSASMENHKDKAAIVRELRLAKESLDKSISIAQEGLWDKIKNKVDRVFTTRKSLAKQIPVVSSNYDSKGQKEGVLTEKYLSVYLNPENKTEASSADVVKILEQLNKIYNGDEVIKILDKMVTIADGVVDTLAKHNSNPAGGELSKLASMSDEIEASLKQFNDILQTNKPSKASEASLATCSPEDKNKIITLCTRILSDKEADRKFDVLWEKAEKLYDALKMEEVYSYRGDYVADKPTDGANAVADEVQLKLEKAFRAYDGLFTITFNVVHSAVRYIEMSTNK